ncbi:MAG: hypothetical protein IKZ88_03585 [Neisseriaceae bacterium]|nr:hypothetical protein [Neisseriaceae bacterium]
MGILAHQTARQGGIKVVKIQSINACGVMVGWQAHPTAFLYFFQAA